MVLKLGSTSLKKHPVCIPEPQFFLPTLFVFYPPKRRRFFSWGSNVRIAVEMSEMQFRKEIVMKSHKQLSMTITVIKMLRSNAMSELRFKCWNCSSHPPIGGYHPVPCLSTQIAKRQGTVMYNKTYCFYEILIQKFDRISEYICISE